MNVCVWVVSKCQLLAVTVGGCHMFEQRDDGGDHSEARHDDDDDDDDDGTESHMQPLKHLDFSR